MVPWVASRQLAAVLADGIESQAGWMLTAALPRLSGGVPVSHWAAWLCSQMMLLLPDVLRTDYSFLMCGERMLNVARIPEFLYYAPLIFLLCHWLAGRVVGVVR